MASKETRPVIALAMGDPAGISLELAAKLMADEEARSLANYIVCLLYTSDAADDLLQV